MVLEPLKALNQEATDMIRTWKCPDCGKAAEISYDWLAEHGGPVCEKCDCDMQLQPVTCKGAE
jgi:hypothetical protein